MFRLLNNRRGQNTAEYAILIGVIVAAAIAMQIYVRRGMQARMKDAVDYSLNARDPEGVQVFTTSQFEPSQSESSFETTIDSDTWEATQQGGIVTRGIVREQQARTGNVTFNYTEEGY
ncbi:hypothetical protein ACFL2J_00245 [Candidatus Omnitrophota bacterium]